MAQLNNQTLEFWEVDEPVLAAGEAIVNVASVPQRSPFRYPGGKTWLIPKIRAWMAHQEKRPKLFVEPFAGGGIVSLTVAFENLADHVVMVELDDGVAAVWKTIFEKGGAEWLGDKIVSYEITRSGCERDLKTSSEDIRELAFLTILRNRVCRGGILAPGAGLIGFGENGKGVLSRWYPETLRRRILEIAQVRDRITFIHGDAFTIIRKYKDRKNTAFFIDPPYTASAKKAGSRLYSHSQLDHSRLFKDASAVNGDVLLTYDNAQEIEDLAREARLSTRLVAMKNTHHAEMREMLIGKNLDWVT